MTRDEAYGIGYDAACTGDDHADLCPFPAGELADAWAQGVADFHGCDGPEDEPYDNCGDHDETNYDPYAGCDVFEVDYCDDGGW